MTAIIDIHESMPENAMAEARLKLTVVSSLGANALVDSRCPRTALNDLSNLNAGPRSWRSVRCLRSENVLLTLS